MADPDLALIVVAHGSRADVLECLRAALDDAARSGLAAEAVVVDNDSRDGTPDAVAAGFPAVRVLANRVNAGYARAVNQGLAATRAPFALILNPDCLVRPGALGALLGHARARPRVALVGPQLRGPDGALELSARSFPGPPALLFHRGSLLTRLFPRNRWSRDYLLGDWDHATARDVDWLSGACLLVRREAVAEVGGMDEGFFLFHEDVDWCLRMRRAGWIVAYEPAAVATHRMGVSRGAVPPAVTWARHLAMRRYVHKHRVVPAALLPLADALVLGRAVAVMLLDALRPRRR